MGLTAASSTQGRLPYLPPLALVAPEEAHHLPGPKESVILLGPHCPSWAAILSVVDAKAEELGVGGKGGLDEEEPLAALIFTFDQRLYPALKAHSAPKERDDKSTRKPATAIAAPRKPPSTPATQEASYEGTVGPRRKEEAEGKGVTERVERRLSGRTPTASQGHMRNVSERVAPAIPSSASCTSPRRLQSLRAGGRSWADPGEQSSSSSTTSSSSSSSSTTHTARDNRDVDLRHLVLRRIGVLRSEAKSMDPTTRRRDVVTMLARACYSAIERVGGKERVRNLDAVVADRMDRSHRLGDTEVGLAELEDQVGAPCSFDRDKGQYAGTRRRGPTSRVFWTSSQSLQGVGRLYGHGGDAWFILRGTSKGPTYGPPLRRRSRSHSKRSRRRSPTESDGSQSEDSGAEDELGGRPGKRRRSSSRESGGRSLSRSRSRGRKRY